MTPVTTAQTAWGTGYTAHVTTQPAARSATQQKNTDRAAVVTLVRALVGRLQASADVDDTAHGDLGALLGAWESEPGDAHWNPDADLDADGWVGHSDLGSILLTDWGCPWQDERATSGRAPARGMRSARPRGGDYSSRCRPLTAYSVARTSRKTVTLISPGKVVSSSIFLAMSRASFRED